MKDENCFMMVLICMKTMKMESIYLTKKHNVFFITYFAVMCDVFKHTLSLSN